MAIRNYEGCPGFVDNDSCRGTGRTTNIILKTVQLALANPGRWVTCVDHQPMGGMTVREGAVRVLGALNVQCTTDGNKVRVVPRPSKAVPLQLSCSEINPDQAAKADQL